MVCRKCVLVIEYLKKDEREIEIKNIIFWVIFIKFFVMCGCIRGVLKVIIFYNIVYFFLSECIFIGVRISV